MALFSPNLLHRFITPYTVLYRLILLFFHGIFYNAPLNKRALSGS